MTNLGYHICVRLNDRRVIAPSIQERRILARVVLDQGRAHDLYVFGYPDTHLHLAARCDRLQAGRLAHNVGVSLKRRLRLPVGFSQYPPKPIEDNRHLANTIRYILRQSEHHGLDNDPGREGCSVPDLLGMRTIGQYTARNVQRWLPRLKRAELLEMLAVASLEPSDEPLHAIIPAALAAGCRNDLKGSDRAMVALRRAVVSIVGERLSTPALADMLAVSDRSIYWLRKQPLDQDLVTAIRLQLGLALASEVVAQQ